MENQSLPDFRRLAVRRNAAFTGGWGEYASWRSAGEMGRCRARTRTTLCVPGPLAMDQRSFRRASSSDTGMNALGLVAPNARSSHARRRTPSRRSPDRHRNPAAQTRPTFPARRSRTKLREPRDPAAARKRRSPRSVRALRPPPLPTYRGARKRDAPASSSSPAARSTIDHRGGRKRAEVGGRRGIPGTKRRTYSGLRSPGDTKKSEHRERNEMPFWRLPGVLR